MRKDFYITLDDEGTKLKFRIHQMSAVQTESWLIRLALLMASCGAKIDLSSGSGFSAILSAVSENPLTLVSGMKYEDLKPLLDELMRTCTRVDGRAEIECTDDLLDGMISSVSTLARLRWEVIKANLDFFSAGSASASPSSPIISVGEK